MCCYLKSVFDVQLVNDGVRTVIEDAADHAGVTSCSLQCLWGEHAQREPRHRLTATNESHQWIHRLLMKTTIDNG